MQDHRRGLLLAALVLGTVGPTHAQHPGYLAAAPIRFESWHAPIDLSSSGTAVAQRFEPVRKNRTRQALLGGAIGAAAGVIGCTVISTLANDSAKDGLSFCPLDSYLLIGGAGFVVGAAIGWML
jgi:hypothetical protein